MLEVSRVLSAWVCKTDPRANAEHLAFRPRSTALMPVEGHWLGKGDIVCRPQIHFPFCVECKCVEGGKLDSILESPRWPVWDWWKQTVRQADASNPKLFPMLVFTRNHRGNYVMLWERDILSFFPVVAAQSTPNLRVSPPSEQGLDRVFVCLLDAFCRWRVVDPEFFPDRPQF